MKVYISGPITGVENYRRNFAWADQYLRKKGHEVLSPTECTPVCKGEDCTQANEGHDWECWMRGALTMMLEAEAIFMLAGWQKSRGARIEHFLALECGMAVIE